MFSDIPMFTTTIEIAGINETNSDSLSKNLLKSIAESLMVNEETIELDFGSKNTNKIRDAKEKHPWIRVKIALTNQIDTGAVLKTLDDEFGFGFAPSFAKELPKAMNRNPILEGIAITKIKTIKRITGKDPTFRSYQ